MSLFHSCLSNVNSFTLILRLPSQLFTMLYNLLLELVFSPSSQLFIIPLKHIFHHFCISILYSLLLMPSQNLFPLQFYQVICLQYTFHAFQYTPYHVSSPTHSSTHTSTHTYHISTTTTINLPLLTLPIPHTIRDIAVRTKYPFSIEPHTGIIISARSKI